MTISELNSDTNFYYDLEKQFEKIIWHLSWFKIKPLINLKYLKSISSAPSNTSVNIHFTPLCVLR